MIRYFHNVRNYIRVIQHSDAIVNCDAIIQVNSDVIVQVNTAIITSFVHRQAFSDRLAPRTGQQRSSDAHHREHDNHTGSYLRARAWM